MKLKIELNLYKIIIFIIKIIIKFINKIILLIIFFKKNPMQVIIWIKGILFNIRLRKEFECPSATRIFYIIIFGTF